MPAPLRLVALQHAAGEGPGAIGAWADARGHALDVVHLHRGDVLPSLAALDWLVVLGGPMGVTDDEQHPWLAAERRLVADAVVGGRTVLGVCLGAQLLAHALGADVTRNAEPEIGWFPVAGVDDAVDAASPLAPFAAGMVAFHWHFDTFAAPAGTRLLLRSAACAAQGFAIGERVVGVQFHPEMTRDGVAHLVRACADELQPGSRHVQSAGEIEAGLRHLPAMHAALDEMLDRLAAATHARPHAA